MVRNKTKTLKRYLLVFNLLIKNSVKSQFQYRTNIIARLLASTFELFINLAFFSIIFQHTYLIIDWDYKEILIFIFTFDFTKSILSSLFVKNLSKIEDILLNGKFDYYITKPIDNQFYTSMQQISIPHLIHSIMPFTLLIFTTLNNNLIIGFMNIIYFIVFIIFGIIATYSAWTLIMSSCFYLIKIKALHEVFLEIVQLGKYPKAIYTLPIKIVFSTMIPVLLMSSYPCEIYLRGFTFSSLGLILISIIMLIISRYTWNISVNNYDSTGG